MSNSRLQKGSGASDVRPTYEDGDEQPLTPVTVVNSLRPEDGASTPYRLGRYLLLAPMGKRGTAELWRALPLGPDQGDRPIVVHRFAPALIQDARFRSGFMGQLCCRLEHPHIIKVHELGEAEGILFIAREDVRGRTLGEVVSRLTRRGEPLPAELAAEIGRQACLGLAYAHELKDESGRALHLVHGRLSPSSLVISFAGVVKILDLGIAPVVEEAQRVEGEAGWRHAYMAPEQFDGPVDGSVDGRADLFALGVILHEALTGRHLFRGDEDEIKQLITQAPIAPPSTLNATVPQQLEDVVMRALEREPERRFASAAHMAFALDAFLTERHFDPQRLVHVMAALFGDDVAAPPAVLGAMPTSAPSGMGSDACDSISQVATWTAAALPEVPAATVSEPIAVPRDRSRLLPLVVGLAAAVLVAGGGFLLHIRISATHASPPVVPTAAPAAQPPPDFSPATPPPESVPVPLPVPPEPESLQIEEARQPVAPKPRKAKRHKPAQRQHQQMNAPRGGVSGPARHTP